MEELRRREAQARGETATPRPEPRDAARPDDREPDDASDDRTTATTGADDGRPTPTTTATTEPTGRSRPRGRRPAAAIRGRRRPGRPGRRRPGRRPRPAPDRPRGSSSRLVIASSLLLSVRDRPLDRRDLVHERRLRRGLLDAARRAGRAVRRRRSSRRSSSCSATSGSPAGSPPPATGRGRHAPAFDRPPQRGGARPRTAGAPASAPRCAVRPARRRRRGTLAVDADDMPDLTPLAGVGHRRRRARSSPSRSAARSPAAWETILLWQQPRAVRARRRDRRHRPGLRPGHRLLPVRAAVPAPRPGLFIGLLIGALLVAAGPLPRRRARGGLVFRRRSGSISPSSAGCS